jgi:hypothetical protein
MRGTLIAFLAMAVLDGCADTGALSNPDAGARLDGTDASCEIVSSAQVRAEPWLAGLLDPNLSEDQDPDRITVVYNGNLVPADSAMGARSYIVPECAGHTVFELSHTVSHVFIGRAEWDVVDVLTTFNDWITFLDFMDAHEMRLIFPGVILYVFGEPGAYSIADMHPEWGPSKIDKELWRFHIVNAMLNEKLTLRLVSGDLDQKGWQVTPDGDMQTLLVTNMAPRSNTIIEDVDHVRWTECGVVPTKSMALELYEGASADPSNLRNLVSLTIPGPSRCGGALGPYPSGSVMFVKVENWSSLSLEAYFFACRDPLYAVSHEDGPYSCPED